MDRTHPCGATKAWALGWFGSRLNRGQDDAGADRGGTITQYVGRLHRLHEGKREVRVYDYADLEVPMLARMFDRRCRGYEAAGYTILLPASALPGWPSVDGEDHPPLGRRIGICRCKRQDLTVPRRV